jgi:hypothetical protein
MPRQTPRLWICNGENEQLTVSEPHELRFTIRISTPGHVRVGVHRITLPLLLMRLQGEKDNLYLDLPNNKNPGDFRRDLLISVKLYASERQRLFYSKIMIAAAITVVHFPFLSPTADCVMFMVRTILFDKR